MTDKLRELVERLEKQAAEIASIAQPSFDWQKSCHYTAENIEAMIADLRAVENGTESIEWINRDHRTKAGILWRVLLALSHDVPVAQPSKEWLDEAMQKDAERYRWLRNAYNWSENGPAPMVATCEDTIYGDALDRSIDAARGEKK